mgnify:CR=1 FL=1
MVRPKKLKGNLVGRQGSFSALSGAGESPSALNQSALPAPSHSCGCDKSKTKLCVKHGRY